VSGNGATRRPSDFQIQQHRVDLSRLSVEASVVRCEDYEDALGGIARAFKLLETCPVEDAYDPRATLLMNLGILTGTDFMTGLRTYFSAYSPLKSSRSGKPSAMWSAGSCKFGTKLRDLDVHEVLLTGRAESPLLLHIHRERPDGPPAFDFVDGSELVGLWTNHKIQWLHDVYPDAYFAVIGPAGENWQHVRYAAVALSTENQLKSGDQKARWCGRGGMGGIMGSKNLLAIIADTPDRTRPKAPPVLKDINIEVARGKGSARFRDQDKANGGGGTWANYQALNPVHALPEMNFNPTGTAVSVPLYRPHVEQGPYVIKDESCYRCGISCHKNVYDPGENGKAGRFRAKLDFEPLCLLSSNIGIFNVDEACNLVELCDELGMDSISLGTTLSYAMEYNRRHPDRPIADGLRYGDYDQAHAAIEQIGTGRLPQLGQGTLRLSQQLGEPGYAMHSKGMEYPAYLPQTNPGYPWALAGGHMSMRTYLLLLYERETSLDYWVDAITNRGLSILRDDFLGACKFCGLSDDLMCQAVEALTGLKFDVDTLKRVIRRTFLRGYRLERRQGFTDDDYTMPAEAHQQNTGIELPYFNTPEFFGELKPRVMRRIEEMLVEEGLG
jgi:aldehyde:ferredoxin oxidoreductase